MNYAAALSLRVEEIMDELRDPAYVAAVASHSWTDLDENSLYEQALLQALEEMGDRAWAKSNICFGEILDYRFRYSRTRRLLCGRRIGNDRES